MTEGIVVNVLQSEDMYGYSAAMVLMTDSNITLINKLKDNFTRMKEIDPKIGAVTYFLNPLDVELFNDEFDCDDEPILSEFNDSEIEEYSNLDDNDCKVDSPMLTVTQNGIKVSWNSKYASGEVWMDLEFETIDKLLKS